MRYLLLALLLAPTVARAQALRFVSDGLIAGDCVTTHLALKRPGTVESNPLLGFRPTTARLAIWCGTALVANDVGVRWLVGRRDGQYIWAAVALIEALAVRHNAVTLGWRIKL